MSSAEAADGNAQSASVLCVPPEAAERQRRRFCAAGGGGAERGGLAPNVRVSGREGQNQKMPNFVSDIFGSGPYIYFAYGRKKRTGRERF